MTSAFIPASLHRHLLSCADFAAEDAVTQHRLMVMLWKSLEPGRQHRDFPGMAAFTKIETRRIWGSDQRMRERLAGKHFIAFESDYWRSRTVAYQPTQEMLDGVFSCIADPQPTVLLDECGDQVRQFPTAIDPYTLNKRKTRATAWTNAQPANAVPVSADGLLALRPLVTPLEQQVIDAMVRLSRNTVVPGALPQRYAQAATGRLTAVSAFSLQSATRRVRAAATEGCWDYDIANCHFAIMSGLAERLGVRVPHIHAYLAEKQATRSAIAQEAQITVKQVKECLLMVIYGAPLSTSPKVSMSKEIGAAAVARLQRSGTFVGIYGEVKHMRTPIIQAHAQRARWVVNAMRLRASPDASAASLLAHIMQGYEAAALRAVVRLHGPRILLCIHDGWVTRERLSIPECERVILDETGLPLRIEEKHLAHPVADGRLRTEYEYENGKFSFSDQGLATVDSFSHATNSRLRGMPLEVVHRGMDIRMLMPRCNWNLPRLE
jgi:hypothetical protein